MNANLELIPGFVRTHPSAAKRWLSCPGSAWIDMALEEQPTINTKKGEILPPGRAPGPYAAEGTTAHARLAGILSGKPPRDFLKAGEKLVDMPLADIQALEGIAKAILGLAKLNGYELYVEEKMELRFKVAVGKGHVSHVMEGTGDIVLVNDSEVMVLDYKHGAGRRVKVEYNPQLTLYGQMALARWPGRELTIGVLQPRGVGKGLDFWPCSNDYLKTFNDNVLAALQRIYKPWPDFCIGPWCKDFCGGQDLGICPAMQEQALRWAVKIRKPGGVKIQGAWWLIESSKIARAVSEKVSDEALRFAKAGGKVPGYQLEKVAGNRTWRDPQTVARALAMLTGGKTEEFLKPPAAPKPIGITDAERDPRIKGQSLDSLTTKPILEVLKPERKSFLVFDEE